LNSGRTSGLRKSKYWPRHVLIDFPMARQTALLAIYRIYPHRAQELATVLFEVPYQILPLHGATTPAGTSDTSLLARKCK
jgi:hypothetical protein